MRLGIHAPGIAPGSRMERAVVGLAARGHATHVVGRVPAGSALGTEPASGGAPSEPGREVDVVLSGRRAAPAAWWAARLQARAVVLALEPEDHVRWGPLDRWAWSVTGAHGIVDEGATPHFLARTSDEERERLALWPERGGHSAEGEAADPAEGTDPSVLPETTVLERACERVLARRAAGPGRAALFVDRDGTLIAEREYLSQPHEVELLPGVGAALREVRGAGHPVVVISNQAGVGRGFFPESRVHAVMARMRALLRLEGVELDAIRYCPHAPDAGCDCRKPGGRLLREAADDLRLSLRDSVMAGDRWLDVDAGRGVGATGVLLRTGYGVEEAMLAVERGPDTRIFEDLAAAARWFIARAD